MNAKSVHYIYSIQLICLVTTYIRGACASHCRTICLGWSISRNNLTITCKISDLHFAVYFYDPDGYEVGSCLQPTTTSDCKITHQTSDFQRNYTIKQNLVTNETYLIVKGNINHKINGKWTCRHGARKQKETVEVNVLELKELGKTENKGTVCYITLTVLLLVTIGFIIVTRLTLGFLEMIYENRMSRDHCVECSRVVTTRQQALTCDNCERWVHRVCNTGITQTDYRRLMKGNLDIAFTCNLCKNTTENAAVESTKLEQDSEQRSTLTGYDRTDFISFEVRIGILIEKRYKKLEKRTRKHCGWLTITGLKHFTLILMTLFDLAVVIPATFNKFGDCTVPYFLILVQAAYGISIVFIFLQNGGHIRRNSDYDTVSVNDEETQMKGHIRRNSEIDRVSVNDEENQMKGHIRRNSEIDRVSFNDEENQMKGHIRRNSDIDRVSVNDEENQMKGEDKDSCQREENASNDIHKHIPLIDE